MIGSFNDTPAHYLVLVQEKLQPDTEKPTLMWLSRNRRTRAQRP